MWLACSSDRNRPEPRGRPVRSCGSVSSPWAVYSDHQRQTVSRETPSRLAKSASAKLGSRPFRARKRSASRTSSDNCRASRKVMAKIRPYGSPCLFYLCSPVAWLREDRSDRGDIFLKSSGPAVGWSRVWENILLSSRSGLDCLRQDQE